MTAQPGRPQAPFTAGELTPTIQDRTDLKYRRAGALFMRNVEVVPQGGFRNAPGSWQVARVRGNLDVIPYAGVIANAPYGGSTASAIDGDPDTVFTSGTISGSSAVVLDLEFPSDVNVAAVDLTGFAATMPCTVALDYNAGSGWQRLGVRTVSTASRSRRFAEGAGISITARRWRVVVLDITGSGTIAITNMLFYAEANAYGPARLRPFMARDGSETLHVITRNNGDVFADGYLASYYVPYGDASLPALRSIQQLDTMVMFHKDVAPHRVLRQGSDSEWQSAAAPLINLPLHDYGGVYGNGIPAVWDIDIIGAPTDATADDGRYVITVNGEETPGLIIPLNGGSTAPDWDAFASLVQAALIDLPGISPGIQVVSIASEPKLRITFSGGDNSGNEWLVSMRCVNVNDIACSAFLSTKGVKPGEPIISAARGWPRCGAFYQQCMLIGGFDGLPNAWMKSEQGGYYNFDTLSASPSGAMLVPMDTDGGEAIEEMVAGRSLMILTSMAEYFVAERALSKTSAPNHVQASTYGSAAGIPAVSNEGSAIFAGKSGGVLYEFRYDDIGQTFKTENLSLLASHLVTDARDQAIRKPTRNNDASQNYVALADGEARVFSLLRAQDVTAGLRRTTPGKFIAFANSNGANRMAAITERAVGAGVRRYVERFDPDALLDQSVRKTFMSPTAVISGLGDFEGAAVWALADDDVYGPFTVSSGAITLPTGALNVVIGRWTAPRVETMPPDRSIGPGVVLERRARIHTVHISLIDTTSLAIGANGGKIYDVPLLKFGDQIGVPGLQKKLTGTVKVQGLTGFSDKPTVVITQKRPGFLNVRSITIEADL